MGTKGLWTYLMKYATHFGSLRSYVNYLKEILGKCNISCSIDGLNMMNDAKRIGGDNFIVIIYNNLVELLMLGINVTICMDGTPYVEKKFTIDNRRKGRELAEIKLNKMLQKKDYVKELNISDCVLNDCISNESSFLEETFETVPSRRGYVKNSYSYSKKIEWLKQKMMKITGFDIDILHDLCSILNIPIHYASKEADALLSKLSMDNKCDFIISNDMDLLTFGCKRMIKVEKSGIYEFEQNIILKSLEFTTIDQFINMCVLRGCDYTEINPDKTLEEIRQYVLKYDTIENILNAEINLSEYNNYMDDYKKAIEIYKYGADHEKVDYFSTIVQQINTNILIKFFVNNTTSHMSLNEKNSIFEHVTKINNLSKTSYGVDDILSKTSDPANKNNSVNNELQKYYNQPSTFTFKKIGDKINFISIQHLNENIIMSCHPCKFIL
jgi:5'-3' exonuclease